MRVELPARDLTLDDVVELAADDPARRYELDNGTLVVMPPSDVEHGTAITRLVSWLTQHGYPPTDVLTNVGLTTVGPTTGRRPDLVVLRPTSMVRWSGWIRMTSRSSWRSCLADRSSANRAVLLDELPEEPPPKL